LKLDEKNSELKTALHCALDGGHYYCAKLLIESEANPNTADIFVVTPVHSAVEHGWTDLVDCMLKRGAVLDAVRKDSHETPLLAAIRTVNQDCVDLLLSLGASTIASDKSGTNTPNIPPEISRKYPLPYSSQGPAH
jgi:ankyrin repeat protein